MADFYSPKIPYYLDPDVIAFTTYDIFDKHAPRITGHMESCTDYEVYGDQVYFWNDAEYADYQDYLEGKDGHLGAYYGWWHLTLPDTFQHVLDQAEYDSKHDTFNQSISDIVDKVFKEYNP